MSNVSIQVWDQIDVRKHTCVHTPTHIDVDTYYMNPCTHTLLAIHGAAKTNTMIFILYILLASFIVLASFHGRLLFHAARDICRQEP